jgi:hypothetical protein
MNCIAGTPECRTLLSDFAKIDRDPAPRPIMLLPFHCFKDHRYAGKQKAPRKVRGAVGKPADVDGNYLRKAPQNAHDRAPVTKPGCEECQRQEDLVIMPRS